MSKNAGTWGVPTSIVELGRSTPPRGELAVEAAIEAGGVGIEPTLASVMMPFE